MQVVMGLEELRERLPQPVITIGNFDGVHLGHQALFAKAVERAEALQGTALAMTFEPHPIRVLRPAVNLPLITPLEQKLQLMAEYGLDMTLCLRFDQHFAGLSADAFVDKLLVGRLEAAEVVVGYDFAFGHKGLGDLDLLRSKGEKWGFQVHVVGPVIIDGRPVSSTRVRQEVADGNMEAARHLLGRHYQVAGRVVAGHGRGGRLLGFPTANLRVSDELLPGPGVYAVLVELADGRFLKGANNIGNNPTFDDGALSVETHLLDFDGDLYGQDIRLHFVERLRGEKRFESPEELKSQIGKDIARAIEVLDPWAKAHNGKKV
ncbi:MAG: bifunctional riboflavin kinase/FAD synthetase [Deltaproteobacteria bacterium]|nr:bifunctional riboflavin kinase/FAD synthetase [Deltaproteobacteria bacterium]